MLISDFFPFITSMPSVCRPITSTSQETGMYSLSGNMNTRLMLTRKGTPSCLDLFTHSDPEAGAKGCYPVGCKRRGTMKRSRSIANTESILGMVTRTCAGRWSAA